MPFQGINFDDDDEGSEPVSLLNRITGFLIIYKQQTYTEVNNSYVLTICSKFIG
jgi:hypothetical protein